MRKLLPLLPRPSRYAGIEDGVILKDPSTVSLRLALAFPDAYEVGMSYLGHKILYGIVNDRPGWQAERAMAPEKEASLILRGHGALLATLETGTPLRDMDAVGFAVTHELSYTDVLHMLDLAGIPLRHAQRPESLADCPVIMAGGGAMLGAEPLSAFIDLALLGDGEELLPEVLECLEAAKKAGLSRSAFLRKAAEIDGVYVPSHYAENADGSLRPLRPGPRPKRRIVADLNAAAYPARQPAPLGAVHNRLALEIARGCGRGCRFCHAGMVYRPVRERSPENLASILDQCLDSTGFEEVSFLSLSAGDYSCLDQLWDAAFRRCADEQISLALPSLRVGSVNDGILGKMEALRRTGCTLAPEAGSQRLRDVINKGITEEELLAHARLLLEHGWRQVKLYFMIGLPTETEADLDAIVDLCRKTRDAGGAGAPRLRVTAALSPFVPKPFTPFQWEGQIGREEIRRRTARCASLFKREKSLAVRWHNPDSTHLEGILSRGGRKLADVVEKAYRKGAVFCGWSEHFDLRPWQEALEECGLSAEELAGPRKPGEPLPWSHIDAGISEDFLLRERERARAGITTPDCRFGECSGCGACGSLGLPVFAKDAEPGAGARKQAQGGAPIAIPSRQSLPKVGSQLTRRLAHYRIWHSKLGDYSFLSQLELQAVISRLLRRAKLPVAFSQGFHPLPLVSFGRALPVGAQSEVEWIGLTLHTFLPPQRLMERLNLFLPPQMAVHAVELVEKRRKTEQSVAEAFRLAFENEAACAEGAAHFATFAARDEFIWTKSARNGERSQNIRPFLRGWRKTGQNLEFVADWSAGYVSPLTLASTILSEGAGPFPALIKTRQIFADGRECAKQNPDNPGLPGRGPH